MINVLKLLAICFVALYSSTPVSAKMHFLPDYQESFSGRSSDYKYADDRKQWEDQWKDQGSNTTNTKDGITHNGICPNGDIDHASVAKLISEGDRICIISGSYPGIGICYLSCKCNKDKYEFKEEDRKPGYNYSNKCYDGNTYYQTQTKKDCPNDSKIKVEDCPTAPENGYYQLDSYIVDYSGEDTCHLCELHCNNGWTGDDCSEATSCSPGYAINPDQCTPINPANGKWVLGDENGESSEGLACKKCEIECDDGYTLENDSCVPADCPTDYPYTSETVPTNPEHGTYTPYGCSGKSGNLDCCQYKLDCDDGWEGSDCSSKKSCPNNSAINKNACGSIDNGYYELGSYNSSFSGDEQCRSCTIKCNAGYDLSGNTCTENPCTDYNLNNPPSNGTYDTCLRGTTTKYKLTGCKDGYIQSSNTCTENPCTGFNLSSCPANGQCSECQSGASKKIKLNGCASNYTPSIDGSSCTPTIQSGGDGGDNVGEEEYDVACDNDSYDICPANSICTSITCSTGTRQKVTDCENNYTLYNNACICKDPYRETHYADGSTSCDESSFDCSEYTLTECPPHGSCTVAGCGSTPYKLLSCDFGWLKQGDACVCDWGSYTRDECPSNAECNNKTCDGTTQYLITKCTESGYKVENNECVCDWPDDYTITNDKYNEDSAYYASFRCGDDVRLKVTMCKSGYELSADGKACECTDEIYEKYPLTQCPDNANCSPESLFSRQCSDGRHYKISSCKNGTSKSADGKECVCIYPDGYNLYEEDLDRTTSSYSKSTCNGVSRYKLGLCLTGYTKNEEGDECVCYWSTGYDLEYCPVGAECYEQSCIYKNQTEKRFKHAGRCKTNYELSDEGICEKIACSLEEYPLSECPENSLLCSDETCDGTTKYKLEKCRAGYKPNEAGDACEPCDWEDYYFTQCPSHANCGDPMTCGIMTKYRIDSCEDGYRKVEKYDTWPVCVCNSTPEKGYSKTNCNRCSQENVYICDEWEDTTCDTGTYCKIENCKSPYRLIAGYCINTEECADLFTSIPDYSQCVVEQCGGKDQYRCSCTYNTETCAAQADQCQYKLAGTPDENDCLDCEAYDCAEGYMTSEDCINSVSHGKGELKEEKQCGEKRCGKCIVTCAPGWEGDNCSQETGCPPYTTTSTECIDIEGGKMCPSDTPSGDYSGNNLCKEYVVSCNEGYTLEGDSCVKNSVSSGGDGGNGDSSSCPTGYAKNASDCTNQIVPRADDTSGINFTSTFTTYQSVAQFVNGAPHPTLAGCSYCQPVCTKGYTIYTYQTNDGSYRTTCRCPWPKTVNENKNGVCLCDWDDHLKDYNLIEASLDKNRVNYHSRTCDSTTKYKFLSCKYGYTESPAGSGVCECDWGGDLSEYNLEACPEGGSCREYTCDGTTKYQLYNCKSGYKETEDGNSCECDWDVDDKYTELGEWTTGEAEKDNLCPKHGLCAERTCGNTTKVYLYDCQPLYKKEGNKCNFLGIG